MLLQAARRRRRDGRLHAHDNSGVGPCINRRAAIGNKAKADAAISIHADGGPPRGHGFHVIYPGLVRGYTEPIVSPSRKLARRHPGRARPKG